MDQKKRNCQGLPDVVNKQTPNSLYTPYHPRIEKFTLAVHPAVFLMVNGGLFYHIDIQLKNLASSSPLNVSQLVMLIGHGLLNLLEKHHQQTLTMLFRGRVVL